MRLKHTFLVLLFALFYLTACSGKRPQDDRYRTLKIYHTNDVHAHLSPDAQGRGGLAYLTSVLKVIRQQDEDSLILDGGDFYKKGSLPAQNSGDEVTADVLSHLPFYDARAVGNNEVKLGIDKLLRFAKEKELAPLLSANFVDKNSHPAFLPYIIFKKSGLSVGVIGITAPILLEANLQPDPEKDPTSPYKILNPEDVLPRVIKEVRPQVDILILLSHQNFVDNVKAAKMHPEIDLIVSGHSHVLTPDQKNHGGNMVVEAGQFGHQLGVVTLAYDVTTKRVSNLESTFWPIGEELQLADGPISEIIRDAYRKWAPDAFTRLGEASEEMKIIDVKNRYEAPLDDWLADVFCRAAHCDVAFVNREMLREPIYQGHITRESVFFATPYDDKLATAEISRKHLEKILKTGITRSFAKANQFGFGLSRATAQIKVNGDKLVGTNILITSDKKVLTLALPHYVVTHCTEFFAETDCPFVNVKVFAGVRALAEAEIVRQKEVRPPVANRIVVTDTEEVPPSMTDE